MIVFSIFLLGFYRISVPTSFIILSCFVQDGLNNLVEVEGTSKIAGTFKLPAHPATATAPVLASKCAMPNLGKRLDNDLGD